MIPVKDSSNHSIFRRECKFFSYGCNLGSSKTLFKLSVFQQESFCFKSLIILLICATSIIHESIINGSSRESHLCKFLFYLLSDSWSKRNILRSIEDSSHDFLDISIPCKHTLIISKGLYSSRSV